jgi:hypothetical protein
VSSVNFSVKSASSSVLPQMPIPVFALVLLLETKGQVEDENDDEED